MPTQVLILPNDSIDQAKQRAQKRSATNIKEEKQDAVTKLTITYPDDPKVLGTWSKEIAEGKAG